MYKKLIYSFLILCLCDLIIEIKSNNEVSVKFKQISINGLRKTVDGKQIDYFLGIPYAEPPIGKLRFRRPKPIQYLKSINATNWPNVCYQDANISESSYASRNMSEDCLFLNIWSPKIGNESKPVMFWIHGGGLIAGSASNDLYNGEVLASRGDVVVVTINYRLQAFGFLYTGSDDAPGNAGLWDQAMALKWVNDNIAVFGGDPKQVTIFGESAGSWSVGLHLLSPITRELYKNAIMMSCAPLSHLTGENPIRAKNNWLKVAKHAECGNGLDFNQTVIECLINLSPEKLSKAANQRDLTTDISGFMSQVRYGDEFLPQRPIEMLRNGNYKGNIILLAGFTSDEGSWILSERLDPKRYSHKNPVNFTKSQAYEELKHLSSRLKFPNNESVNGDIVSKLYLSHLPNNDYDLIRRTIGIALGDFYISCTTSLFAKYLYEGNKINNKVFQYYFTAKFKIDDQQNYCSAWQGACHSTDLAPSFGYLLRYPDMYTKEEMSLSKKMVDSLTFFAKNGYPPAQDGVDWMSYYSIEDQVIQTYYEFSNNPKPNGNFGIGLKTDECEKLWNHYIELQ